MNYDSLVSFIIIITIILVGWAKVTKQTVAEVIGDIKDIISGGREEAEDRVDDIYSYD